MDRTSTFVHFGVPESLATAVVLILLSLSLAPWFGGTELGPLKVPKLPETLNRWVRVLAPVCLLLFSCGFLKVWPNQPVEASSLTYAEYLAGFFDTSKSQAVHGKLYPMNELEVRELRRILGGTRWDGGDKWGLISFDEAGRIGTYTNQPGRSPGTLLIQGVPGGTVPILVGEWEQKDGQSGRVMLIIPGGSGGERLGVAWGPSFTIHGEWKRQ
jgi:hypothetical protein